MPAAATVYFVVTHWTAALNISVDYLSPALAIELAGPDAAHLRAPPFAAAGRTRHRYQFKPAGPHRLPYGRI